MRHSAKFHPTYIIAKRNFQNFQHQKFENVYENSQITRFFLIKSSFPVVVNVLNVVVVLQQVDELLHVLDVGLISQGNVVLGDSK